MSKATMFLFREDSQAVGQKLGIFARLAEVTGPGFQAAQARKW